MNTNTRRTFATKAEPFLIATVDNQPATVFGYRLTDAADLPDWVNARGFAVHPSTSSLDARLTRNSGIRCDNWVVTELTTGLRVCGYSARTAREAVTEAAQRLYKVGYQKYLDAVAKATPVAALVSP